MKSACADAYFECLARAGIQHKENRRAKAWIHTLLASRDTPDLRLGDAACKGYLPFTDPAFAPLLDLINKL